MVLLFCFFINYHHLAPWMRTRSVRSRMAYQALTERDFMMALSNTQTEQGKALPLPTALKLQRILLAACLVLAPLVIALGFAFDPQLGIPQGGVSGQIAALQAENPLMFQFFLFFNVVTLFVFPLSYIGLGLLAMRRSPWLATIGIACGLVGSLPWPLFVGTEALGHSIILIGKNAAFVALGNHYNSEWAVVFLFLCWVIGHLLGYVFLGIALARARAIPLWAAWLFVVSVPFQMVGYPAKQGLFQILGFVLVFIASIPAALAMLKMRDAEAPVRIDEKSASAT